MSLENKEYNSNILKSTILEYAGIIAGVYGVLNPDADIKRKIAGAVGGLMFYFIGRIYREKAKEIENKEIISKLEEIASKKENIGTEINTQILK